MSRRRSQHFKSLPAWLQEYSDKRAMEFHIYSPYHMRLMDGGFVCLDIWTTGKYYVKETNYVDIQKGIIERGGEKGEIETVSQKKLNEWLDKLFYPVEEQE